MAEKKRGLAFSEYRRSALVLVGEIYTTAIVKLHGMCICVLLSPELSNAIKT